MGQVEGLEEEKRFKKTNKPLAVCIDGYKGKMVEGSGVFC